MRTAPLSALLVLLASAATVHAQATECNAFSGDAGRVCTAAVDATRAFHPVLGGLISGGNPILGSGGPLGGPGHLSVTARVNAVEVVLPDLAYDGTAASVPSGQKVFAPAPQVEAAVGLYGGMPSGLLAIDALGSAQLLPTSVFDHFSVAPGARRVGDVALGLGFGARVGILRETGPLPGISVSVMRRDLPTIAYGSVQSGDEFQYSVNLHATNLRLVAGKQLAIVTLAGGLGWDKYTGDALIQTRAGSVTQPGAQVPINLSSSRATVFLDAGLDLVALKLVGEAGYQTGKDQSLTTDFQGFDTTKGKVYAGLGLRVGL
jgi:hypothetical protein